MTLNKVTLMTRYLLAAALLLAGCDSMDEPETDAGPGMDAGDDTGTDAGPDTTTDAGGVDAGPGEVLTGTCTGSETTSTNVLNTGAGYAYYDLDTAAVVTASDAGWDFRMDRWMIELNTGVEAVGFMGAYDEFDDRCLAPSSWTGADISSWYDYAGPPTHEITAVDMMFYVLTSEGAYHRLRFDGYTEDGGMLHTPGITHGEIAPPM